MRRTTRLYLIGSAIMLPVSSLLAAANISLVNSNQQCSGFSDPTPAASVGGNTGMTLGQQRLNAFQYAANLIAPYLNTNVEIKVDAQMNALGGSAYSAILGQAGPMSMARDFSGAPLGNTYYPIALAETLHGGDLNGDSDIVAEFNSDLDNNTVLGNIGWYYGLNQGGGINVDYITVIQHELIHGLGFLSLLDASGRKFYGRNDIFLLKLEGHGYGPADLPSMTDSQRATAIIDNGNLHWAGSQVITNSSSLSGGVDGNQHVYMYAPSSYSAGSSVSHFSTAVSPNEGMEPYYTGPDHTPGLAVYLLKDIGWNITTGTGSADLHLALTDSGNNQLGANNTYTLTISNNGGSTAVETVVTYMLPYGHDYISATPSSGSCRQANHIISCALGNLAAMGSATVGVVANMKAAGSHSHAAVVNSATAETNYTDNRISKTTTVSGTTDLVLSMSPQQGNFIQGVNYTYTATLNNSGPSAATNVALQYELPAGLSFVSATTGSCCSANGATIKCHVAELAANTQHQFSFVVNAVNKGSYVANPFLSQNQTDTNSGNDSYGVDINVTADQTSNDKCFIATAAFGSLLHPQVKWLRLFRDRVLLTNTAGNAFVRFYYHYSPPLAERLRQHDVLRALMRGSLGPLIVLSRWLGTAGD